MNHSSDSQEQPLQKKIRRQGRLSGSMLSLALLRLRADGGAIFHSPHGVTYEQLGKGNNEFINLEEATSLYPTPAQIPEFLLPSREVLDTVKNSQGEVVRCPFCPSTFSGIVVQKSFKRHLQRHWNHAAARKDDQIDQPKLNLSASLISPIAQPVPDMKNPSNTPGAQQSSHALLTSASPLITPTDHAPTSAPLTPPKCPLIPTTPVHVASNTPKSPARKKGRKSVTTSTLGTVRKDNTTLAIARTMEILRSKTGIVVHRPDAHPNLEHQSFTQREGQFLDVDATFSMFPTIDELPESFWPTPHQYTDAAPGEHRIRCLFCTWSFTGVYVKANFRGHLRYHWKLAAAQKANSSPANARLLSAKDTPSYGPITSSLGPTKVIKSGHLLQSDVVGSSTLTAAQPSLLCKIRSGRIDQIATPGSLVTNPEALRPQGRKRNYTEAFLVEDIPSIVDLKTGTASAEDITNGEVFRFVRIHVHGMSEPEEEHHCIVSILEDVCGIDILDEEWYGEVDQKSGAPSVLMWKPVSPIPLSGSITKRIAELIPTQSTFNRLDCFVGRRSVLEELQRHNV